MPIAKTKQQQKQKTGKERVWRWEMEIRSLFPDKLNSRYLLGDTLHESHNKNKLKKALCTLYMLDSILGTENFMS